MSHVDLIICGAGPVGCTVARLAADIGWSVLIVERRNHIAGNCYDELHAPSGVLVHRYGPHYFRTNDFGLMSFLSRFSAWMPANYIVKSFARGELFPFPINLLTLRQFFRRDFTEEEARAFLEQTAENIPDPRNSEEFVLSRVGRELYEAFYKGYTEKQWGRSARELAPSICGRIPVRFNEDSRYVDHRYQVMPRRGYTHLFENMIDHPNIRVLLGVDFLTVKHFFRPKRATLYTGPIDEYFGCRHGRLPWRSLHFEFVEHDAEFIQPCVQINYPNDHAFTRTVEIKHVTGQKNRKTVISFEYPRDHGEPYYPIPSIEAESLYRVYSKLADEETRTNKVFFAGRLATYRYINMDEAIGKAFGIFERIRLRREEGT